VGDIKAEHPEYIAKKPVLRMYRDLYVGGERLKVNAANYLTRRQKEPLDVYHERLGRVFYENYVGSIIDWYAATLFRRESMVMSEGDNEAGRKFLSEFTDDCDRRGGSLSEVFRRRLIETLICGVSYVLVDFPRTGKPAGNRAEEEITGASRAYLVECSPEDVINWSHDESGNFEWIVVRTEQRSRRSFDDPEMVTETRWTYYDKTDFRTYLQVEGGGSKSAVELVDAGRHALARQGRVPVFELKIPEGLWLMNKAGLLQLEHFNKSNALSWALSMGLFASPVVYTDREWDQIVGESYYIQLGPEDKFGWTEPEGHVYQIAADNLKRLQEEIYRVCYLLSQGGRHVVQPFRPVGIEQAARLCGDSGGPTDLRRCREGHDQGDSAGDCGCAAGRAGGRCIGSGRVRHWRVWQRTGRCREAAGFRDRIADPQEADLQEACLQVSLRCPAGGEGPDCGGD